MPDAVIVVDPFGDIVAANPTAWSVFRALGLDQVRRVEQLPLPADSLDAVRGQLRGDGTGVTRPDLNRLLEVALNGRQAKLLPTVMPIPEFSGGRPGAVVVLYDVTEFARLDELRAEMIAVASHELKTPLTTLRMNLMLMRERVEELSPLLREMVATAALGCEDSPRRSTSYSTSRESRRASSGSTSTGSICWAWRGISPTSFCRGSRSMMFALILYEDATRQSSRETPRGSVWCFPTCSLTRSSTPQTAAV